MTSVNKNALRWFSMKSAALNSGQSTQLNLAIIGDSWTDLSGYYLDNFLKLFRKNNYGVAAGGFIEAVRNYSGTMEATTSKTGTWTSNTTTAISPSMGTISATSAAEWIVTLKLSHTNFRLVYEGTGGVAEYSINGGASYTPVTLSGSGVQTVDIATGGVFNFRIRWVSGTVTISGVDCRHSSRRGVVIHKLGRAGSDTQRWAGATAAQMEASFAALDIDAAIILLGTNDATAGRSAANFLTNLNTIATRIRTAHPGDGTTPSPDIIYAPSPECYRVSPIDMVPYFTIVASNAEAQDVVGLDLQGVFGDPATRKGWFDTDEGGTIDGLHPIPATSGLILANKLYKELMF